MIGLCLFFVLFVLELCLSVFGCVRMCLVHVCVCFVLDSDCVCLCLNWLYFVLRIMFLHGLYCQTPRFRPRTRS